MENSRQNPTDLFINVAGKKRRFTCFYPNNQPNLHHQKSRNLGGFTVFFFLKPRNQPIFQPFCSKTSFSRFAIKLRGGWKLVKDLEGGSNKDNRKLKVSPNKLFLLHVFGSIFQFLRRANPINPALPFWLKELHILQRLLRYMQICFWSRHSPKNRLTKLPQK